jgi:hypothetical protein
VRLLTSLLSTCIKLNDINVLPAIISHFKQSNVHTDTVLQKLLIAAYDKLGDIKNVYQLWKEMKVNL